MCSITVYQIVAILLICCFPTGYRQLMHAVLPFGVQFYKLPLAVRQLPSSHTAFCSEQQTMTSLS